eukprot:Hpha_TRINITY_DN16255_c2_g1::TRINITY_DN16255_c2_g1_i6::g.11778::m.11778
MPTHPLKSPQGVLQKLVVMPGLVTAAHRGDVGLLPAAADPPQLLGPTTPPFSSSLCPLRADDSNAFPSSRVPLAKQSCWGTTQKSNFCNQFLTVLSGTSALGGGFASVFQHNPP